MEINKIKKSQVSELVSNISSFYDFNCDFLNSYIFYINENSGKVHISNINVEHTDIDISRLNSIGMYFGTFHDNNRFRLSIEGANLIKPKNNFLKIKEEFLKDYLSGEDISCDCFYDIKKDIAPFLIVIFEDNCFGSVSIKDNNIINYIPKSRRVNKDKLY